MATPDLKVYMREHSQIIRKKSHHKKVDYYIDEDPEVETPPGLGRLVLCILCRNKQRLLQQAWNILSKKTGVIHDYSFDLRRILSRPLPNDEPRTEFEIEVLWKWMVQNASSDPTGVASMLSHCRTKQAVIDTLQNCRLERYGPGDMILYQNSAPRPEDGVFTIFSGECEVLSLPTSSMQLLRMQEAVAARKWDAANGCLRGAQVLGTLHVNAGFGELATLSNTKRTSSIRASISKGGAEVLVVPKQQLLACLDARRSSVGGAQTNEVIDFLRQTGLANRMSSQDLVTAAGNMVKRVMYHGEILFCKGEPVQSLYLVLSGDFILDTGGSGVVDSAFKPFFHANPDRCYHISANSILGDEGMVGSSNCFESTAVVVSEIAVVFEVVDGGINILLERLEAARYSALTYKDISRLSPAPALAEESNIYSFFSSLRKVVASVRPYRGVQPPELEASALSMIRQQSTSRPGSSHGLQITNTSNTGSPKFPSASSSSPKPKSKRMSIIEKSMAATNRHASIKMSMHQAFSANDEDTINSSAEEQASIKEETIRNGIKYTKDLTTNTTRRTVFGMALHHAVEAYRHAKKVEEKRIKSNAEDSIILDQAHKDSSHMTVTEKATLLKLENKLETQLSKFRERKALEIIKNFEDSHMHMHDVHAAVSLFSSLAKSLGYDKGGEDDDDEEDDDGLEKPKFERTGSLSSQGKSGQDLLSDGSASLLPYHDESIFSEDRLRALGLVHRIDQGWKMKQQLKAVKEALAASKLFERSAEDMEDDAFNDDGPGGGLRKPVVPTINLKTLGRSSSRANLRRGGEMASPAPMLRNRGKSVRIQPAGAGAGAGDEGRDASRQQSQPLERAPSSSALANKPKFFRLETPNIRRVVSWNEESTTLQSSVSDESTFEGPIFLLLQKFESPRGFFEALQKVQFPARSQARGGNDWNTRFLKINAGANSRDNDRALTPATTKAKNKSNPPLTAAVGGTDDDEDDGSQSLELTPSEQGDGHADDVHQVFGQSHSQNHNQSQSQNQSRRGRGSRGGLDDEEQAFIADLTKLFETGPADEANNNAGHTPHDSHSHSRVGTGHGHSHGHDSVGSRRHSEAMSEDSQEGLLASLLQSRDGHGSSGTPASAAAAGVATPAGKNDRPLTADELARMNLDYPMGTLHTINPHSDAIEKYFEVRNADRPSRKYLDGKKKANSTSRFQLRTELLPFHQIDAAERRTRQLEGKEPSLADHDPQAALEKSQMTLLAALQPNAFTSTASVAKPDDDFTANIKNSHSVRSIASHLDTVTSSLKDYISPTVRSLDSEAHRILEKQYDDVLFNSLKYSHENRFSSNQSAANDLDMVTWQRFSVAQSVRINEGPKMTLPVLVQSSSAVGLSEKLSRGKRAKRWGSGGMVPIGGVTDYQKLTGPPSYLDVYKKNTKARMNG